MRIINKRTRRLEVKYNRFETDRAHNLIDMFENKDSPWLYSLALELSDGKIVRGPKIKKMERQGWSLTIVADNMENQGPASVMAVLLLSNSGYVNARHYLNMPAGYKCTLQFTINVKLPDAKG